MSKQYQKQKETWKRQERERILKFAVENYKCDPQGFYYKLVKELLYKGDVEDFSTFKEEEKEKEYQIFKNAREVVNRLRSRN